MFVFVVHIIFSKKVTGSKKRFPTYHNSQVAISELPTLYYKNEIIITLYKQSIHIDRHSFIFCKAYGGG